MNVLTRDRAHPVQLVLNGQPRRATTEPRQLLSDFLRQELGQTGTHVGCEHGVCGACTVRIDGVAQRACLMLALQVDGCAVQTIEGLASQTGGDSDTLGDLQAAFKRHHALQCGFCTAGILMSAADWLQRVPQPGEAQVREMLSGHLCRCTGYTPIVAAILEVAQARAVAHAQNTAKASHV
jgi:2-furoyl-CoA dehydrogenase 2Fe-2S iron sulfur subunit